MDTQREGNAIKVKLKLKNRVPHSFPTGAPFRNAYIKLAAYDKDGKVLWQNFKTHPSKDDPKAMFSFEMGTHGQPAMPPEATEILADTRLKPNEVRELEYSIPADDKIAIIRAEMLFSPVTGSFIELLAAYLPCSWAVWPTGRGRASGLAQIPQGTE
jgi:hypothetical protein